MAKTITSRPNIFGRTSHYDEHGKKIGESRPAIFGGTNHYDAKGHKIGYSRPGILVSFTGIGLRANMRISEIPKQALALPDTYINAIL